MVPQILAYLDEMALVGVVDQAKWVHVPPGGDHGLAAYATLSTPSQSAHFSASRRERMQAQFADLESHPMLSSLFAAERAVYLHARAIAEKNLAMQPTSGALSSKLISQRQRSASDSAQGLIVAR